MDAASDIPGSPVAWNGLLLTVPAHWTPATIDTRYLFFTKEDRAMLECKWTPEQGPVSMQRKRRHLEKRMQRTEGFTFAADAIPARWTETLAYIPDTFQVLPFTHAMGNGALCLHRPTNTSLLLHSYSVADEDIAALQNVLASLQMVPSKGPLPFDIFDIHFTLPFGYELRRSEFRPGHTCLEFGFGMSTLTVCRITPANVVLQGQPFRAWLHDEMDVPLAIIRKDKEHLPEGARKRYQWQLVQEPSFMRRLSLFRAGKRRGHKRGTAWIVEDENKLVVVTHESAGDAASDRDAFADVWRSVRIGEAV